MSWVLEIHPRFGPVGLALAILLAAYALFVEPILGRWWYARLKREREQDPQALLRVYRLTLLGGPGVLAQPRVDVVAAEGNHRADEYEDRGAVAPPLL